MIAIVDYGCISESENIAEVFVTHNCQLTVRQKSRNPLLFAVKYTVLVRYADLNHVFPFFCVVSYSEDHGYKTADSIAFICAAEHDT